MSVDIPFEDMDTVLALKFTLNTALSARFTLFFSRLFMLGRVLGPLTGSSFTRIRNLQASVDKDIQIIITQYCHFIVHIIDLIYFTIHVSL